MPRRMPQTRRGVVMPASSQAQVSQPQLCTEVQVAEGVGEPPGCDFPTIATQAFAKAACHGWADEFLARAGSISQCDLCVRLVTRAEGETLNSTWRGKPVATNVLSFAAEVVADQFAALGDLVLCADVVEREAEEQNKLLADHYTHLTVHGILHLLGYDHVDETEAEAMETMEVAILDSLGVANPYEDGTS